MIYRTIYQTEGWRNGILAAITRGIPARSGSTATSSHAASIAATRSREPKPSSITSQPPGRRTRAASATIRSVDLEARSPAEQRDVRLEIADLALQAFALA